MHAAQMKVRNALGAAVMSLLVVGVRGQAQAADRFVSTAGSDTANDCLSSGSPCRTVGYALAQAASGDTVKVAGGSYVENLTVNASTTVTVSGGWADDFSAQNPDSIRTVLRAGVELPVVTILADGITIALTVEGLSITHGQNFPETLGVPCEEGDGGGICAKVASGGSLSLALNRVVLDGNRANRSGGGLWAAAFDTGSSLTVAVTESTVTRNAAAGGGGMMITTDAYASLDATLDGVFFGKNRAAGLRRDSFHFAQPRGGGLSIAPGPNGHAEVRNSIFRGNIAAYGFEFAGGTGGGISAFTANCGMPSCLRVVNTVFIGNRAAAAFGAIQVYGGAELVNVTATRNRLSGVAMEGGTVRDSILWGNRGDSPGRDLSVTTTPPNVELDHSDVGELRGPVTDLGGNISANPLLVKDGIHLTAGSPAIDTGTCPGAPTTDFEGDPRPTGAGCDMGADEFVP